MSGRGNTQIDPRGQRFAAAITSVVLGLAIVLGTPIGLVLLAVQTFVFAFGAVLGLHLQPYAVIYRRYVAPRLSPPTALTSDRPSRFAQGLGMLISVIALLAGTVGADAVFYLFAGAALAAAFLNAAFTYCLGCDLYRRFSHISHHADLTDKRVDRDVTVG